MSSKKKTARDNHFYKVLGAFVKDLREKRKLTRDEAADILGTSRQNIHNLEEGKACPQFHRLCDFLIALGKDTKEVSKIIVKLIELRR